MYALQMRVFLLCNTKFCFSLLWKNHFLIEFGVPKQMVAPRTGFLHWTTGRHDEQSFIETALVRVGTLILKTKAAKLCTVHAIRKGRLTIGLVEEFLLIFLVSARCGLKGWWMVTKIFTLHVQVMAICLNICQCLCLCIIKQFLVYFDALDVI